MITQAKKSHGQDIGTYGMDTKGIRSKDSKTNYVETQHTRIPDLKGKAEGLDVDHQEITDPYLVRRRRIRQMKRKHQKKHRIMKQVFAAVIFIILICTISYRSIKVQANTGFKYYTSVTVESGDTLWHIADQYIDYGHYTDKSAYIAEIESINHLEADEILLAGTMLIIPYYSAEYVQ